MNVTAPMNKPNQITLGRIFIDFHDLEEIHIQHSALPAIGESSFWPGKNIRILNLSFNRFTMIRDTDFNNLTNLKELYLSDNRLSHAPSASFRYLLNLTKLILARNKFTKLVPRLFYKLDKLIYLDLSENPIQEVHPDDFKDIKSLEYLLVGGCQLQKVHSLIYQSLPNLIELDFSNNQFHFISPYEFISLTKLKVLKLNGNKISVLVDYTFSGLYHLEVVNLSNNIITSLSSCTFCNSSIKTLYISNNKFTSFQPRGLEPLSYSLMALFADANQHLIDSTLSIAYLIKPLRRLKYLSLTSLLLDDNIQDSTFYNLQTLQFLNFSNNHFVNLSSRVFDQLVHLKILDLSFNKINSIREELINKLMNISSLEAIYFNDNPWSCTRCEVLPMKLWINTSPASYYNVCRHNSASASASASASTSTSTFCIKCISPATLAGKYLHQIHELELKWCNDPSVHERLAAPEPSVGMFLAFFIIFSLIIVIISVVVIYNQQGAVYYTHEEDKQYMNEKNRMFSITSSNTAVKQIPFDYQSSPTITSSDQSKPDSPIPGTSTMKIRPKVQIYI